MADYRQEFFTKYIPIAMQVEKDTGVPAALILSQAALESNYGRSGLSQRDNNFFGIKGTGTAGSRAYPTTENYGGKNVRITAAFRKYTSPEESFRDHARLLLTSPNYRSVMAAAQTGDLGKVVAAIDASPYATDPQYGSKLSTIIAQNKLNEISPNYAPPEPVAQTQETKSLATKLKETLIPRVQAYEGIETPITNQTNRFQPTTMAQVPTPLTTLNNSMTQIRSNRVPTPSTYIVKRGDTLSGIARQQLGNASRFREIGGYKSNNPNLIFPGEKLTLPGR